MKKILIANTVNSVVEGEKDFLGRQDIQLFTAATSDDVLALHRTEKMDLIVLGAGLPGMAAEELGSLIRKDPELKAVSLIILCRDDPAALERASRCGANAVMTLPVSSDRLLERARRLIDISSRGSYRVLVSVTVEGSVKDRTFFGRSENISATGMLLETDKVLKKGDRLKCSFFLPDAPQLLTTAEIVRDIEQAANAKSRKYGVQFLSLSPEAKASLREFIDRKARLSASGKQLPAKRLP
jgi:DNA-binding response OmpR family regulator